MTYSKGDTVRIGKGKTDWKITGNKTVDGAFQVQSPKGVNRYVLPEDLTPIKAASQPVPEDRNDHRSSSYGKAILQGLQNKPVYQGTVPSNVIEDRRKAGKVAKASRKANR